ncbi:MAG: invasion associated locus B family protein [Siculibacillus sp.]
MRTAFGALAMVVAVAATTTTALAQAKPAAAAPTKPAAAAPAKPAAPAAGSPMLLVESKDWKAITAAGAKGKMCFALTKPQKSEPPTLNHGEVFFFVTTRPAENIRSEPSLQVGYPLKENTKVVVDIGGKKFNFFTRGDGAWLEQNTDYAPFLDAMRKGSKIAVSATSGRGNPTSYVFSLAGIGGALDAVAKECK